jgi:hypothetical protein
VFRKKRTGFISVHNETLYFVSLDQHDIWQCVQSIPLINIIGKDPVDFFPKSLKTYDYPLLVVPDFWFGNSKYPFHSHNKAVIAAFIKRKLISEFPQTPKIIDFYSYDIVKNDNGEQEIITHFLQEPEAFDLYQLLTRNNLRPVRISSFALLWNQKLKKSIDIFEKIGLGLIYLFENRCSLFFYFRGHFLFSRTISLPEFQDDYTKQFEIITYEMNQSIYHFSQRTKTDLDKIYFSSGTEIHVDQLSEMLGREVLVLSSTIGRRKPLLDVELREWIAADFSPEEILEPLSLPGVSDRAAANDLEWKKIQFAGIIIGVFLLIVLGFEFMFLTQVRESEYLSLSATEAGPTQLIGQYNEALDVLSKEAGKKDPMDLIGRLATCVSGNIRIESIDVSIDPSTTVSLTGVIRANGVDDFSNSLRAFLERINITIQSNSPLSMDDVNIEIKGDRPEGDGQDYHISFKLDVS